MNASVATDEKLGMSVISCQTTAGISTSPYRMRSRLNCGEADQR